MKRTLSLLLALVMILSLAACSSSNPAPASPTPAPVSDAPVADAPVTTPDADTPAPATTPFEEFNALLDDAGYSYETVTMGAELVGAKAGEKYKFDFGSFELYQYEDGSETLAQAVQDGGVTLEGFGVMPCVFNGNLVAFVNLTENEDAILSLFNSL